MFSALSRNHKSNIHWRKETATPELISFHKNIRAKICIRLVSIAAHVGVCVGEHVIRVALFHTRVRVGKKVPCRWRWRLRHARIVFADSLPWGYSHLPPATHSTNRINNRAAAVRNNPSSAGRPLTSYPSRGAPPRIALTPDRQWTLCELTIASCTVYTFDFWFRVPYLMLPAHEALKVNSEIDPLSTATLGSKALEEFPYNQYFCDSRLTQNNAQTNFTFNFFSKYLTTTHFWA